MNSIGRSKELQQPPGYDPDWARAAFDRFLPVAMDLASHDIERVNIDPDDATLRAIRVGNVANRAEAYSRFSTLGPAGFNMNHVTNLADLGWALYFARLEWRRREVVSTVAKLPLQMADQATAVRNRMLRLVGYYLEDHPVEGPEISDIRSGVGYVDLMKDLDRLAAMVERNEAVLATDTKNYVAGDPKVARQFSVGIAAKLSEGLSPEYRDHAELVARFFTLLRRSYNEVRAAAQWLFRNEPEMLAEFPGMRSVVSTPRPAASEPQTNQPTPATV